MKKFIAFTVACAFVLTSLNVYAVGPNATTFYNDEIIPVDERQYNECTDEFIHYTGSLHIITQGVMNKKRIRTKLNISYENLEGIGETSGAYYSGNIVQNQKTIQEIDGVASEITTRVRGKIKTAGPDNNLTISSYVHTSIDENGEVTTTATSSLECL